MADVHTVAAGTATGVDEEPVAALVGVEDAIKVTVREEETAAQPSMRFVACKTLEAIE